MMKHEQDYLAYLISHEINVDEDLQKKQLKKIFFTKSLFRTYWSNEEIIRLDKKYEDDILRYIYLINKVFSAIVGITSLESLELDYLTGIMAEDLTIYHIPVKINHSQILISILYEISTQKAIAYTIHESMDNSYYIGRYTPLETIYTNLYNAILLYKIILLYRIMLPYVRFMRLFGLSPPVFLRK